MAVTQGIHHITAIAGNPARNVTFYTKVLGLRLVKKTVNFDDPGTYHLYYGDGSGSPGTILTFFPWDNALPGGRGAGEASGAAFAITPASLPYWLDRLQEHQVQHELPVRRFDETVVTFSDPDGMSLELVAKDSVADMLGWTNGDIPEQHSIRGFSGITLWSTQPARTAEVLKTLGYRGGLNVGGVDFWITGERGLGTSIQIKDATAMLPAHSGAGSVHHVAFRAADDAAQKDMAEKIRALGLGVTEQKDRNYFRSVYFREPGGTLFEIATDAPGFAVDEAPESLGQALMLPSWLEPRRSDIEAALPLLTPKTR